MKVISKSHYSNYKKACCCQLKIENPLYLFLGLAPLVWGYTEVEPQIRHQTSVRGIQPLSQLRAYIFEHCTFPHLMSTSR